MARRIVRRPEVRSDLVEYAARIAGDRLVTAMAFLDAAEDSFDLISRYPLIGQECGFRNPRLHGLRVWPIRGFENYLLFYFPLDDVVEIVRVLHGSRDVESILNPPGLK